HVRPTTCSTPIPYTTLFRSNVEEHATARTDAPPKDLEAFLQTPIHHLGLLINNENPDRNIEFTLVPGDSESASSILIGSENEDRSEEHTSELQSLRHLVCRL